LSAGEATSAHKAASDDPHRLTFITTYELSSRSGAKVLGLLGNRILRSEIQKRGPLSATRTADAMSIAENKQDCVPGLVPADGTMLPIGEIET
jgi:hypothetical protein